LSGRNGQNPKKTLFERRGIERERKTYIQTERERERERERDKHIERRNKWRE
jgi:hypothetical protein